LPGGRMRHRRTLRWVDAAMAKPAPNRNWLILSDLIGRLEVECTNCKRRGRYRVDKLLAEHGDRPLSEIMEAIARKGGCPKALYPLGPHDAGFVTGRCRISRVS
jgi:hypothetical protein